MPSTQDILFAVSGQSLVFDAPEGRPSDGGTFAVYSAKGSDTGTVEFEGSVTVDSVNTTVSGASGFSESNRKDILLTSTAGIAVDRQYLVTNASSQSEWVDVVAVNGFHVESRYELQNDYEFGATFVGTRLSAPVDTTWVGSDNKLSDTDKGNPGYRVRWAYSVDGVTRNVYSFIDLVRAPGGHDVTLNDLEPFFPGLRTTLDRDFRGATNKILDDAYLNFKLDLKSIDWDEDNLLDRFVVNQLVIRRALHDLAMAGYHPKNIAWADYNALRASEYNVAFDKHFRIVMRTASSQSSDSGASELSEFELIR